MAIRSILIAFIVILSWTGAQASEPLKIHFISGSKEYKSESSLKEFQKHLEAEYNIAVSASWVKDGAKDLPEIENIPKADVLLVFARRMKLPEEQMAVIRKHWDSGKPIVGIRTSSHAFQKEDNAIFDRVVMGGNYTGHFGKESVKVENTETGKTHPVLKGVGEIVSKKLYKTGALGEGVALLQNGTVEGKKDGTQAVTWTNKYNSGRMFYTSLGVPEDFANEHFVKMIVNAIFWTANKPAGDYAKKP